MAPSSDQASGEPLRYSNRRAGSQEILALLLMFSIPVVIIATRVRSGATVGPILLIALISALVGTWLALGRAAYELEVDETALRWRGLLGPWRSVPLASLTRVGQSGNSYWLELTGGPEVSVGTTRFGVSLSSLRRINIRAGEGLLPFLVALQKRVPGLELF
jgi:hypothetical protein